MRGRSAAQAVCGWASFQPYAESLPGLLSQIRAAIPLSNRLFEDLSQPLVDSLLAGELDVLLLALPFPAEQVETMSLFEDDFLLACPASHPLATRASLKSADLRGESLLLLEEGHCLRDHALEACKLRDSQISVPYQATSLATIVQMVATDIGVTLLPGMAVKAGIVGNRPHGEIIRSNQCHAQDRPNVAEKNAEKGRVSSTW